MNRKTSDSNLRYILYARRSVEKRDREEKVVSIESQIEEMKEVARVCGLKIIKTITETKSAREPYKREGFQEMMRLIEQGKAEGILCWKVDRLARNPVDEGTVKYLLQSGIIQNIKATDRDWYPDDNALLASVEFGVATQYSRDLAKHIRRGLKAKAEQGHRPSIAPLGYLNSHSYDKGNERILVDKERFPLVRKMFDLMLTGMYRPHEIVRIANEEWGLRTREYGRFKTRKVSKSNVYRILTNSFYYGVYEYPVGPGNWYKGKHEPMITRDEFDTIQTLLENKLKPRPVRKTFAYTGLMRCGECGGSITAEEKIKRQRNGNVHRYVYYRCTKRVHKNCQQKPVKEEVLEEQILAFLMSIQIPESFHAWVLGVLQDIYQEDIANGVLIEKQQKGELKTAERKLDALLEMRMNSEITADEYTEKKSLLEQEKLRLEEEIESKPPSQHWTEQVKDSYSLARDAVEAFQNGDTQKRRMILSAFGQNLVLTDKILNIQAEKPIELLQKAHDEIDSINGSLEPQNNESNKRHSERSYSKSCILWRCGIPNFSLIFLASVLFPLPQLPMMVRRIKIVT